MKLIENNLRNIPALCKRYRMSTLLFLCIIFSSHLSAQTTQVIAHRGFWKTEGSAQNSLAALSKADSILCYGSEFDVHLTADKQLIVNHDPSFKGVKIEKASVKECTRLTLSNGENLPTLRQYLKLGKALKTKLILELKTLSTPEDETLAVEKIVKMVRAMNLENRMEYISFSKHAVQEFIRLAPKNTPVYYLNGDAFPQELKQWGCAGADYHISVFKRHPQWINDIHQLGMKVNVWTVNKSDDMQWLIEQGVDFITTNEPVRLQQLLGNYR